MLLPAGFPGYEKCSGNLTPSDDVGASLLLTFPELQLDLRSHDQFMGTSRYCERSVGHDIAVDMSLNVGETRGCIVEACLEDVFFQNECHWRKEALIIDGEYGKYHDVVSTDSYRNQYHGQQTIWASSPDTYICLCLGNWPWQCESTLFNS